ncbi:MAG: hypothetical protein ABIJ56_08195 [Pseudomonadota bacterium]
MATVKSIKKAVSELTEEELAEFREWFEQYDAAAWDRKLEEDVKAGKLDRIAEKALSDHKAGKSKEL